jgi:hypothetical protein
MRDDRGRGRFFAACLLTLGLFLMHGSPEAAAAGCHGGAVAGERSLPSMPKHHQPPAGAQAMTEAGPAAARGAEAAPAGAHSGPLCVSTPARGSFPFLPPATAAPLTLLLAVLALLATAYRLRPYDRRRGPPPTAGRALLTRVCIARN